MIRFAKSVEVRDIAALYHVVWHETHSGFMPVEECNRRDLDFFVDRMTKLMPTTLVIKGELAPVGFSSWHDHLLRADSCFA